MSRVGNSIITIPEGVKIENNTQHLLVTGPNGKLSVDICEEVNIKIEDNNLSVSRNAEDKVSRSMHGTVLMHLTKNRLFSHLSLRRNYLKRLSPSVLARFHCPPNDHASKLQLTSDPWLTLPSYLW